MFEATERSVAENEFFTMRKKMKIILLDGPNVNVYDERLPEEFSQSVRKFLYWDDLIVVSSDPEMTHGQVLARAKSEFWHLVPNKTPKGAGDAWNGMVRFWGSLGFEIITPIELRELITTALGLTQNPRGYKENGRIN